MVQKLDLSNPSPNQFSLKVYFKAFIFMYV